MLKLWNQEAADWRLALRTETEGVGSRLSVEADGKTATLWVGLGNAKTVTAETVRRAAAKGIKTLKGLGAKTVVLDPAAAQTLLEQEGVDAMAQGVALALYRPRSWKTEEQADMTLYMASVLPSDECNSLTDAICLARDLVNCPANHLVPADLARTMTETARTYGVETEIISAEQARALGMEAFLTVGDSAGHAPCLIVLRYRGGAPDQAPIGLVGKGVTCDTGGYCLKPASSMKGIKGDMAGAAAVFGALLALARNKVPVNATVVIPSVENRIAPDSFIPGDVIGSMSGKTIEVGNTDAEGRLILADAITYALRREGVGRVLDIATLTGAVVGMFGFTTAGFLCNDEAYCTDFMEAAAVSGEQYWRLPAFDEYRKMIESPVADVSNVSNDGCGTITAGLFLEAFTESHPWLHIDIAGTAWVDSPKWEYQTNGATGAAVTTLYHLCKAMAKEA